MANSTLHYIYDPLCGWCYGAAPLVKAAREMLSVQAHAGGMMMGVNRQAVTPRLRNYVLPHDARIAKMTGQPFGEAYTEGLLRDTSAVFDSEPPIAAILAAETVAQRGLDMLTALQTAHYVAGRKIADLVVLAQIAGELGLDADAFRAALIAAPTQAHVAESRALLAQLGGQGFPTFAVERDGRWLVLDAGDYLGDVASWQAKLRSFA